MNQSPTLRQSDPDVPRALCEQDIKQHPACFHILIWLDGEPQHNAVAYDLDAGMVKRYVMPPVTDLNGEIATEVLHGHVAVQWQPNEAAEKARALCATGKYPTFAEQMRGEGTNP